METVKLEISIAGLPAIVGLVQAATGVLERLDQAGAVYPDDECVAELIAAAGAVCDAATSDEACVEVEIETTVKVEIEVEADEADGSRNF